MGELYNVLFLCSENAANSIFAEAILNHKGRERNFHAFSGGSFPRNSVHPLALKQLELVHLPIHGLRSKSWSEFARPGAPQMDLMFTVDGDSGKTCALWPGQPVTGHWHVPDPTVAAGTAQELEHAFLETFTLLQRRIDLLMCLSPSALGALRIAKPRARARAAAA